MTPERWRELTTIFHDAREREGAERAAYLDRACGGDAFLRAELESLLAAQGTLGAGPGPGAAALRRDDVRRVPRGRAHRHGRDGPGLPRDRHALATHGGVEAAAAGTDTRSGLQRAIRARGAFARVAQSSERRGHLRVRTGGRGARARPRIRGWRDARAGDRRRQAEDLRARTDARRSRGRSPRPSRPRTTRASSTAISSRPTSRSRRPAS